jgi:hypothetical protein
MENSNIIEALDKMLEKEDDIKVERVLDSIKCSKTQLFEAMYAAQKGYTIAGALTPIATISKNKAG